MADQLDLSLAWSRTPVDVTVDPYTPQVGPRGCTRGACTFRCEAACVWHQRHGEYMGAKYGDGA